MGEEYQNLNVDTRSDTTYKGYHEGKIPYGASYITGTNPFMDIYNAIEYHLGGLYNNPYLYLGEPVILPGRFPFKIKNLKSGLKVLKNSEGVWQRIVQAVKPNKVISKGFVAGNESAPTVVRYPVTLEGLTIRTAKPVNLVNYIDDEASTAAYIDWLLENGKPIPKNLLPKTNPINNVKKLKSNQAPKITSSERYLDKINYNKNTRNKDKIDNAYLTGDARRANSGLSRIRNDLNAYDWNTLKTYKEFKKEAARIELKLSKFEKGSFGHEQAKDAKKALINEYRIKYRGTRKLGGILEFLKKGNKIHIKEKNKGKFTSYCGGTVTDKCIKKAKISGNSKLIKRATFAQNARNWKHKNGGILNGLIF